MTWKCPQCGKEFRNTNQSHSCNSVDVDVHFKNKSPQVHEIYDKLIMQVKKFGKITFNPVKTSIQLKANSTFLSIKPKRDSIEIEFQLDHEVDEFPIYKNFRISKNRVLHFAVLESTKDIKPSLIRWLKQSYKLASG
jgi:hypothetical protein